MACGHRAQILRGLRIEQDVRDRDHQTLVRGVELAIDVEHRRDLGLAQTIGEDISVYLRVHIRVQRVAAVAQLHQEFEARRIVADVTQVVESAVEILRRHAERIGFKPGFSILDREDQKDLLGSANADPAAVLARGPELARRATEAGADAAFAVDVYELLPAPAMD